MNGRIRRPANYKPREDSNEPPAAVRRGGGAAHGQRPILSYDVPQQVSFSLQNHIEIALDASFFLAQGLVTTEGDAA